MFILVSFINSAHFLYGNLSVDQHMFCLSLIPVQNLAKIEPKVIRGLSVFKIYMYVLERCENNGSIYENKLFLLDRFVMTAEIFLVSNHITNWQ